MSAHEQGPRTRWGRSRTGRRRPGRAAVTAAATAVLLAVGALVPAAAAQAQPATTVASPATARPAPAAAPDDARDRIRPGLARKLASRGSADFWVRLDATADLTQARQIQDRDKRGAAVVAELRSTAERSQRAVRARLDATRVRYESFWATNALYVHDGSRALAESVAGLAGVDSLWPTQTYAPVEPVAEDAGGMSPQAVEWGVAGINADDVWARGTTGDGVVIANIDSGVQFDHPALVRQYRGNKGDGTFDHDYSWFDTSDHCSGGAPCDTNGHGTHTMGTMVGSDGGANQIGVAPGARWITANGCATCSNADLAEAGQWMLAPTRVDGSDPDPTKRPDVINNSWGSQIPTNDPFMEDVSEAWAAAGIFAVWSNGNVGPGCRTSGSPGSRTVNYSVGAYDVNGVIADFSSRGSGQDGTVKPDIAAPGVNIRSAAPGSAYRIASGTSMAAPHVAGAVALAWSAEPALVGDVEATRELLDGTAVDTEDLQCGGTAANNNVFGEGRLDALALVEAGDLGPSGRLEGGVVDADSGEPIDGATVRLVGGPVDHPVDRTVHVGPRGDYAAALPVGDYEVTASAFGYAARTGTVTITEGATSDQDFSLTAADTASVTGRVTDGSGQGWPLYAKITVDGVPDGVFYTRPATGEYRISLPVGSYRFTVEAVYPGYQPVTETVDLATTSTHDVSVPVDARTCAANGYAHTYVGETASFDDGALPDGWSIQDHRGNGEVWRFDDPDGRGNRTGGSGGFAIAESDFYGSGHRQDTSLLTPVLDLSAYDAPVVSFAQDFYAATLGFEEGNVDLSLDGGQTWSTVLRQTASARGPRTTSIDIPQAAGRSGVQVRFHYGVADYDWYWQLDDVAIGERSCEPVDGGGYLLGHVRDANTGTGLDGATVTLGDLSVKTRATPADPGTDDGFYWLFAAKTGPQEATASTAGTYVADRRGVDVDGVTPADFALRAGRLSVSHDAVESSLRLGDQDTTRTFTVTNSGTAPAAVSLSEGGGDFVMQKADGETQSLRQIRAASGAPLQRVDVPVSFAATGGPGDPGDAGEDGADHQPAADPWTNIADYPQNIMDNRVVTLGGAVYSVGGSTGGASTTAVWRYEPSELAWTRVADLPSARGGMTVGVVGGRIIASGGWRSAGPDAATWVYDPAADSWSAAASNPAPRAAAGQAVLDGRLYAVGGCTTSGCTPMSSSVVAYDPVADSWQRLADYPLSVAFAACGGVDGRVVCTGGNNGSAATAQTYAYDPAADSWTRVADAPADSWAASYAVADGRLVVVGGVQQGSVTNAAFAYSVGTDSWGALPNANAARYRGGAACGLYRVGGSSGEFNADAASEMLPGFDRCASGNADVEWLTLAESEAVLAPGESLTVPVTMSARVDQPGTYSAVVLIQEDTPYRQSPVAVTMTVTPPTTWGKLTGTVRGLSCDGSATPIRGATVRITSKTAGRTLFTKADGSYASWFDQRSNPLDLIAAMNGFDPQTARARVTSRTPTTVDFDLSRVGC